MGAGYLAPVVGRFAASAGIERSTDAFDLLGDHHRVGSLLSYFEENVLQEMGDALNPRFLETRADSVIEDQTG